MSSILICCMIEGVFSQVMPPGSLTDDEAYPEPSGSQSDRKSSLSINTLDILSVNQLLDSVRQDSCLLSFTYEIYV